MGLGPPDGPDGAGLLLKKSSGCFSNGWVPGKTEAAPPRGSVLLFLGGTVLRLGGAVLLLGGTVLRFGWDRLFLSGTVLLLGGTVLLLAGTVLLFFWVGPFLCRVGPFYFLGGTMGL